MNKIKLTHITPPDFSSVFSKSRMYQVALGNNKRECFSNEKHAKKFLAETNRFLNDKLAELNQIYTLVLCEYRNYWFYLDLKNIELITVKTGGIDKALLKLVTPRYGPNQNYYVFTDFSIVLKSLIDILMILDKALLSDNRYPELHRITFLKKWINQINNELYKPAGTTDNNIVEL